MKPMKDMLQKKNKNNSVTITDINQYLADKGIRPSFHRIKTFEYLLNNKTHPTVDMIFKDLSKDIPTLSKTTIYNTITLFRKKGIISVLNISENESRCDADTSLHVHFKCIKCNQIYDLKLKTDLRFLDKKYLDGHLILEKQIYFKGI